MVVGGEWWWGVGGGVVVGVKPGVKTTKWAKDDLILRGYFKATKKSHCYF